MVPTVAFRPATPRYRSRSPAMEENAASTASTCTYSVTRLVAVPRHLTPRGAVQAPQRSGVSLHQARAVSVIS
jgi:hypothetical protein